MDLVSAGESIIDFIPVLPWKYEARFGGSPMNTAVAAARLGLKVGVLTAVGKDPFGKYIVKTLEKYGVDVSRVRRLPLRTTLAFVYEEEGETEFFFYRRPWTLTADTELKLSREDVEYVLKSRIFHFTGFALSQGSLRDSIYEIIEEVRGKVLVSFDPTFRIDVWKSIEEARKSFQKALDSVNILLATLKEYKVLFNTVDLHEIFEKSKEFKIVGIKMGSKGAIIYSNGEAYEMAVYDVPVRSTVGAGDAWNAGVLYGVVNGLNLKDILRISNAVASLKCRRIGAIEGLPTICLLYTSDAADE